MISFSMLSELVRSLFALWALLLCLINIGSTVIASVKRRFNFSVIALLLFAPAYFMWQIIFDLSLFAGTSKVASLSVSIGSLAWIYWLVIFVLLSVASAFLLAYNIYYDKTFITSGTIKLFLDKVPCGICCWRENGHVVFSNNCMDELCLAITNTALLNGNHFKDAVKSEILSVEGKVWRFSCKEIYSDGECLFEMIASNITKEYAKTIALEKDKAELSRLNRELWDYYLSIDESVRRQEILQAKMNIHDEMNRLMLSTVSASKEDAQALNNIFSLWEQNALLLCMEADKKTEQQHSLAVGSLAEALGISVIWLGDLPSELNGNQKDLFFFAAKEAIVNAVKHAQAKNMEISFEQSGDALLCRFTNDGALPSHEVRFEGGLENIAFLAKKQGADIFIEITDKFTLVLKFHTIG